METCPACGDLVSSEESHHCWVREKWKTQETLPEPDKTAPPVMLYGDVA